MKTWRHLKQEWRMRMLYHLVIVNNYKQFPTGKSWQLLAKVNATKQHQVNRTNRISQTGSKGVICKANKTKFKSHGHRGDITCVDLPSAQKCISMNERQVVFGNKLPRPHKTSRSYDKSFWRKSSWPSTMWQWPYQKLPDPSELRSQ